MTSKRHRCDSSGRIHGHAVPTPDGEYPWEVRIYGARGELLTKGYHHTAEAAEAAVPQIAAGIQRIIRDASLPETDEQRARREEWERGREQAWQDHLAQARASEAAHAEHLRQLAAVEGGSE